MNAALVMRIGTLGAVAVSVLVGWLSFKTYGDYRIAFGQAYLCLLLLALMLYVLCRTLVGLRLEEAKPKGGRVDVTIGEENNLDGVPG